MRLSTSLRLLGVGLAFPLASRAATIVNFHDASQGFSHGYNGGGYNVLMYGQGAFSDPGNNVWNGFGQYDAPGSTDFYGPGNPDSGHGSVPNGNPGQPYAWHNGTSASGTNLFSPTNPGALNTGNATSAGTISPVTITGAYGFDNGANGSATQGSPGWILNHAAVSNGANPIETFVLHNVPAGTYSLYLYGANFDNNRGTAFAVDSGTADLGISATLNDMSGSPASTFIEGANYVIFNGVTPNALGDITITALPNPLDGVGNSNLAGEADVNAIQLVSLASPEPGSLAMVGLAGLGLLARRRRRV
ncbi:MAG: hypothetical protein JWN24_3748 [Phycisphaerales bacterium]|nr:hypothetical protein [Phycisphaerales bacterium]